MRRHPAGQPDEMPVHHHGVFSLKESFANPSQGDLTIATLATPNTHCN